jgi:hypothetical protein
MGQVFYGLETVREWPDVVLARGVGAALVRHKRQSTHEGVASGAAR